MALQHSGIVAAALRLSCCMPHIIIKTKWQQSKCKDSKQQLPLRNSADERVVAVATKANIKILYEQLTGATATATIQAQWHSVMTRKMLPCRGGNNQIIIIKQQEATCLHAAFGAALLWHSGVQVWSFKKGKLENLSISSFPFFLVSDSSFRLLVSRGLTYFRM